MFSVAKARSHILIFSAIFLFSAFHTEQGYGGFASEPEVVEI
jgi:hypothetical protein